MLFPGTAGVSPARQRRKLLADHAGETPAVPGKSTPRLHTTFYPLDSTPDSFFEIDCWLPSGLVTQ